MRCAARVPLLIILLLAVLPPPLQAASAAARQRVAAPSYVRLNDWAKANQFTVRWISPARIVEASNSTARIVFTVDARQDRSKAKINGVQVSLNHPVRFEKNVVFIPRIDISHTLDPILSPPKMSGTRIRTICIDPGHGGADPGFLIGSQAEKKQALLLAQEVRDLLKKAGLNVLMTRSTDVKVPLEERSAMARRHGADLFVSLHFNATQQSRQTVQGVECYCLTPAGVESTNARGAGGSTGGVAGNRNDQKNMLLAWHVQKQLVSRTRAQDRGVKRARFVVLRDASMPAVLVEAGFMSHPAEGRRIADPAYRKQMAQAIVDGILGYKKSVNG